MKINIDKTKQEVAVHFSKYLFNVIKENKKVSIALSGGSTPKIVFEELASNFSDSIDWSGVHFYWGDERCVPPTDSDSNYKMTVDFLISKINILEENIHRIKGEENPSQEALNYSAIIRKNLPEENNLPKFDLIILGMGDDGHTASIFPHEINLWDSNNICEVAVHPDSGQKRISLTGKIINNADTVAFLVTGASKKEKVDVIINKKEDYKLYPASLVAPTSKNLIWFLDADAAQKIEV